MKLDKTFIRDIKKIANGDGGADHRKAFRQTIRAANAELSSPTVRERYSECISKYGRVPVAICTAVTISTVKTGSNGAPSDGLKRCSNAGQIDRTRI